MATDEAKKGAGILGLGAAACAACCAGPILGVIAAAGFLTAAAYVAVGVIGLAIAVPFAVWTIRRRRAKAACEVPPSPTPVEMGSRPAP
jgi:hypothetical protein